jgi:hypothetical protein
MKKTICTLSAGIGAGFSDRLNVHLDTDLNKVVLEVTTGCPVGGMDGDHTPTYRVAERRELGANVTADTLLKSIKQIIAKKDEHLFKDYGRPTKNTWWSVGRGDYDACCGLSIKLCKQALDYVRSTPV